MRILQITHKMVIEDPLYIYLEWQQRMQWSDKWIDSFGSYISNTWAIHWIN